MKKLRLFSKKAHTDACKYTKSVIIIHEFHICKFSYSLKFICNPPINVPRPFCVHLQTGTERWKIWITFTFQSKAKKGGSNLLFQLLYYKCILSMICLISYFLDCCAFCRWFHCLKCPQSIVLNFCSEFLSTRLWYVKKKKIQVLDKLYSGMSCTAIG